MTMEPMDPEFSADTRKRITDRYCKERSKKRDWDWKDEAAVFTKTLEGYANAIPELQRVALPEQQKRKENLTSIRGTLTKLADSLNQLDSNALGWMTYYALQNLEKEIDVEKLMRPYIKPLDEILAHDRGEEPKGKLNHQTAMEYAYYEGRPALVQLLSTLATGAAKTEKNLPVGNYNINLKTALALERTFWEHRLNFTTSNTGFAGICLQAIFSLGGVEVKSVSYWLGLAKNNKESMFYWAAEQTEKTS